MIGPGVLDRNIELTKCNVLRAGKLKGERCTSLLARGNSNLSAMRFDDQFCNVKSEPEMGVLTGIIVRAAHPRMKNGLLVFGRNGRTKIVNAHTVCGKPSIMCC